MTSLPSGLPREVGNYRLERMLGRGGSSEVWLGRHKHLRDRTVAVKILLSHDGEAIERFQREASLTSKLRHSSIVQIYDHGLYAPFYCTVMEYLPGGSLRQMLDRQGKLPLELALSIFRQVAAALDYAHSQSVTHRDVSPGNILLDLPPGPAAAENAAALPASPPEDAAGFPARALLTDFGIAREHGQTRTHVRAIMGTPDFFSPEHVKGATFVTPQSDVFGLGLVLYVMLAGHLPWAELPADTGFKFSTPLPLRSHGVDLPGDVDRILQTLLAIDPAHRYLTAQAAVDALERVFVRHTSATVMISPAGSASAAVPAASAIAANPIEQSYEASGLELHPVEQILGPRLQRAPMQQAQDRAEALRNAAAVADLLDAWSREGPFRVRALGRLAQFRKISSRNIYFYSLRVLYETRRQPEVVEEPDHNARQVPLEPERDHWQSPLPAPQGFNDDAGARAPVKGSTRVVSCGACQNGIKPCPTCKGARRVRVKRQLPSEAAAAPNQQQASATPGPASGSRKAVGGLTTQEVLEPCPTCEGRGGLRCDRCAGTGRLLQRRAFAWSRAARFFEGYDALGDVDMQWFQRCCKPVDLYQERVDDGFHTDWRQVPGLAALLTAAERAIDGDTRVVLSEATIAFVPATDVIFALASDPPLRQGQDERLYGLTIHGFENAIPPDWRFLNRDRALLIFGGGFCVLLALVSLVLLFLLKSVSGS